MFKTINVEVTVPQTLWPYKTVDAIQMTMEEGEATHITNAWRELSVAEHIEHAIEHLKYHELPDPPHEFERDEDHLAHAFTRLMMAVAIERGYM